MVIQLPYVPTKRFSEHVSITCSGSTLSLYLAANCFKRLFTYWMLIGLYYFRKMLVDMDYPLLLGFSF